MVDENVQRAFQKVKEDIDLLKEGLKETKTELLSQKELLMALNGQIKELLDRSPKKKEDLSFFNSSIGNKGVDNDRQQSTMDSGQSWTMVEAEKEEKKVEESLRTLNETLTKRFDSLTDREFATYMAVYDLEKEGDVSYAALSLRLHISESSVRSHISHLLTKKVPLTRERYFNGRSLLYIKKGFRDPKMLDALLKARQRKNTQTTLFDT